MSAAVASARRFSVRRIKEDTRRESRIPSRDFTSANDIHAQFEALVANEYGWAGDELAHLVLALAAERAIERILRVATASANPLGGSREGGSILSRESGSTRYQLQELTAWKFHVAPL